MKKRTPKKNPETISVEIIKHLIGEILVAETNSIFTQWQIDPKSIKSALGSTNIKNILEISKILETFASKFSSIIINVENIDEVESFANDIFYICENWNSGKWYLHEDIEKAVNDYIEKKTK